MGAINSGFPIDANKFEKYAQKTARMFIRLYPWFYLLTHTHQLLMHGGDIIKNPLLPLDKLF